MGIVASIAAAMKVHLLRRHPVGSSSAYVEEKLAQT